MTEDNLNIGLMGPMLTIRIAERYELKSIFDKILPKVKADNLDNYVLFNKLYKKYLNLEDAEKLTKIDFNSYASDFNDSEIIILNKMYNSVVELYEQMLFMIENNEEARALKLIISDVPYYIYDKNQSTEFYDNLSETDEPCWMRKII